MTDKIYRPPKATRLWLVCAVVFLLRTAAFSQCNVESFINFEAGTNGVAATTTTLASSTHGYTVTGSSWTIGDPGVDPVFSTSGNQPAMFPTGTLCGDSTNYAAGQGTLGLQYTGTGVSGTVHNAQITLPTQLQLPTLHEGVWFCSDLPQTDTSIPDTEDIHSSTDFVATNFDGNGVYRYLNLETGSFGTGTVVRINTGNCPSYPTSGDWYFTELILGSTASGIADTLNVYDTTGALVGTVSHPSGNTTTAENSTIGCPNNSTSSVTSGYHCWFDSWQIASTAVNFDPLCTPGSPATTTPDYTSFNTCVSSGGTVDVSAGVVSWGSNVTLPSKALTIIGATTTSGSGDPYVGGGVISAADNTTIRLTNGTGNFGTNSSATNFQDISGFTFNVTSSASLGVIQLNGTHGQYSYRFHGNHVITSTSGAAGTVPLAALNGYGVIDLNFFDDQTPTGGQPVYAPIVFEGDWPSVGNANWADTESIGSNQAIYAERNYFVSPAHGSSYSGIFDAYAGAKMVVRFNTTNGLYLGGGHGTDSGGYRSPVLTEEYRNSLTALVTDLPSAGYSRGGGVLAWGNNFGSGQNFSAYTLNYLRISEPVPAEWGGWGGARVGLNWTPTGTSGTNPNALNPTPSAYAHSHTYGADAAVTESSSGPCFLQTTAGGTTSTTDPACPAVGSTVTDSGGVVWQNVGGSASASLPGGAGYLSTAPDTNCTSGATCTIYFDGLTAGTLPCGFRDQAGCGHNQALLPVYEWLNTGNIPTPLLVPDNGATVANVNYYSYNSSFTGTSGTGSGTLASRPSTCTTGVLYFATDQGNWNMSGNGAGNGVAYACGPTNTWSAYYTPYQYPFLGGSTYTITISSIVGDGTVTSSDSVINCTTGTTGTCSDSTASGTITLTETPAGGYSFTGWGGGTCSGSSSTCAVTGAATVTATFTQNTDATVSTGTAGSITSSGAVISGNSWTCSSPCVNNPTSEGTCYATSPNPTAPCTSDGTSTPFNSTLSGLSASTLYYYRAFATNTVGTAYGSDSSFTTSNSGNIVSPPVNLIIAQQAPKIELQWDASKTEGVDYDIWRSINGGAFAVVKRGLEQLSWTDTDVVRGATYAYKSKAYLPPPCSKNCDSVFSDGVSTVCCQ